VDSQVTSWLTPALVGLTAALQGYLAYVLSKRKMRSTFPIFFAYTVYSAAGSLVMGGFELILGTSSPTYFYLYWVLNAVSMLLEFGLMYEVFVQTLSPYDGLIDLGKILFRWAALFLLLAAGLTAFSTGGSATVKCLASVNLMERCLRLMQCGALLLFFIFEQRLNLPWKTRSVSISIGLGISSATILASSYLRLHFYSWTPILDRCELFAYLGSVAFWTYCFASPEPARRTVLDSPRKLIFQRWNDTLLTSPFAGQSSNLAMASMDSFLPNVERTVERVMARKMTQ